MKIGDLVYDDCYGQGIIVEVDSAGDYSIFFPLMACTPFVLDKQMMDSVEVISESR